MKQARVSVRQKPTSCKKEGTGRAFCAVCAQCEHELDLQVMYELMACANFGSFEVDTMQKRAD